MKVIQWDRALVWIGAWLALCAAGCDHIAGVSEDRALGSCSPGELRCEGNTPQRCNEALAWEDERADCADSDWAPVCSGGACVGIDSIAAGSANTCAVLTDGTLRCWGANRFGQLGNADFAGYSPVPTPVRGLPKVSMVDIGTNQNAAHACAVAGEERAVYCWGANSMAQLGDGTTEARSVPIRVPGLTGVRDIALGYGYSCAVLADGSVACWGMNAYGQAAPQRAEAELLHPEQVTGLQEVKEISAGMMHTCALTDAGDLLCWGNNGFGQIGSMAGNDDDNNIRKPTKVEGIGSVRSFDLGDYHTCAIRGSDGSLVCWGRHDCGQIGNGEICDGRCDDVGVAVDTCAELPPIDIALEKGPRSVSLGAFHSCIVDGITYCWGRNDSGEAGASPDERAVLSPSPVMVGVTTATVALGSYHSCALLQSGQVSCWGRNEYGQLANGTEEAQSAPHSVVWAGP